MASISYFVKTQISDPNKEVNIRIRLRDSITNQSAATGLKVLLKYWDLNKEKKNRKGEIVENKNFQNLNGSYFKGKDELKTKMHKLKAHILEKAEGITKFPIGWLNDIVDHYLFPEKYKCEEDANKLISWCTAYADKSTLHRATVSRYKTTIAYLKEFNPNIDWDDINMSFYFDFIAFLEKKTDKDDKPKYSKNTIGGFIKTIKVFMNAALERGIHNNRAFQSHNFKKPTEESVSIYLNDQELADIYKLDLSEIPYLERVRDQFIVGCWTGCRFSDLDKVKQENIEGNFIRMVQQKTSNRVVIPLHPVVREILEKYDGDLPEMISNQKFNEYIKIVAKKAKIRGFVTKVITRGGKRVSDMIARSEMVSSHTARRSFATNLYKSGFPSISIMAMTGHKTEKAFLTYIKVTEEEHAQLLMDHWNRNGGFLKVG